MKQKFIIAGKEEGFSFRDAKIVGYYGDPTVDVLNLRAQGYTQFLFVEQTGYEYTLDSGETIKGEV